jgi:hypothetical protein
MIRVKRLLGFCLADEMTCWPVSARAGSVTNKYPSLIEPTAVNAPA